MKVPDAAEVVNGSNRGLMKPENSSPRKSYPDKRRASKGMSHLPIEWMDPMSWRLPSGKALAEFALQSGFLAPLILSGPRKKQSTSPLVGSNGIDAAMARKGAPEQSGTFRQTR